MSMSESAILVDHGRPVCRVTLNRPGQRNPLDWPAIRRLRETIAKLELDRDIRVVVISGAGGHFSAGGDLKGYVELYRRPAEFKQFLDDFHALLAGIESSAKIYVAAVQGYCVAGGLELLLACDIVIAARSARIGDAHANFGQLPGAGGSQRLPRTVGPLRAKYLMLTGEIIDAEEAERIGLVTKVVPDDGLPAKLDELQERLLAASPAGLKGAKHLANHGMRMDFEAALKMELAYVHTYATTSADASEGLMAFQEKRKPRFSRL